MPPHAVMARGEETEQQNEKEFVLKKILIPYSEANNSLSIAWPKYF